MKKLWFKRKWYGWGWMPATWQGWLVILLYSFFLIYFALQIDESTTDGEVGIKFIIPFIFLSIALILTAYRTGEKPKWQWGRPKKK